jgi:serine/threonine protein kinase
MTTARTYGDWIARDRLGGGGNGTVYRCEGVGSHNAGLSAAIKIIKRDVVKRRPDRMIRFRNEIEFLLKRGTVPGVLPLLDSALPANPAQPTWYVMPLATPLVKALGARPELAKVVLAVNRIADTLAQLASEGVAHRDIKPDNLFQLEDQWVIGDFGLVSYPEQKPITKHGVAVGPYFFMAPEMRRDADTANGELADVYSLAKTLWSLATGEEYPPPGELRRDRDTQRLSRYVTHNRAPSLELIIERSTRDNPTERPSMQEFANELSWWSDPKPISADADLSAYADEVERLRTVNTVARVETREQFLSRRYNESAQLIFSTITPILGEYFRQAHLDRHGGPRNIEGWSSDTYGGVAQTPSWGIGTIASPWLGTAYGTVHRSHPDTDIEDSYAVFVLAKMTPDSQETYIFERIPFNPDSPISLEQAIAKLTETISANISAAVLQFLTACRTEGIAQNQIQNSSATA